jgi:predicted metal-dependent HD superfamily phosphohydrolase
MYFELPTSALKLLVPLYNSPQRHYHNLTHIYYCLNKLDEYEANNKYANLYDRDYVAITYAIWFHDAVYSPFKWHTTSNEKESEALFRKWWDEEFPSDFSDSLMNASSEGMKSKISEAIRFTEHHLIFPDGIEPSYRKTTYAMLDIDMSGFARSFDEVYKDSTKIFKEYEALGLPEKVMLNHRINFLQALLDKPYIYHTAYFRDTHENAARANIEEVIERSRVELDK